MQTDKFLRIVEAEKRTPFIKQLGRQIEYFPVYPLVWHTSGFYGEKRA